MGDVYTNPPQSRNEAILNSIVEGTTYTDPPQSRIEDLLLQVKDVIEEGGHDESATRASIAPTESDSAHASKKIEVGEQFYLSDDKLYTATSTISQGDAIVVYPTASYNCKLSDSVTEQIGDRMTYSDNGVLGAKNLFDLVAETQTVQGITYTPNLKEGTIAVSGTVEGSFVAYNIFSHRILPAGQYILTAFANSTNISFNAFDLLNGDTLVRNIALSFRDSYEFEILPTDVYDTIRIQLKRATSGSASGTVKPMIRLASDSDSTFKPYAQTNRELTVNKADNTVIGTVEDGATASQAYAQGKFFIRGGKFGKAKTAIAQGDTFTLNTNYEETSIADVLYEIMNS